MTSTRVRRAGFHDLPALLALRTDWKGPADTQFAARFTDWFERESTTRWWWVAERADTAVGMVSLKLIERMPTPTGATTSWGYLCNLFVVPAHRGHGAGAALVNDLLTAARTAQLVRVVLHPSELSVPLYRRLGFTTADSLLVHALERPP